MRIILKFIALFPYILSFLFIRKKNIWAFGSETGFNDNSKYLIEYIIDNCKDISPVWITHKKNDVEKLRAKGIHAYYYMSFKGLFYSLHAYMYIVTGSLADINFYTSGGVKYIQLWHGVGIKSCLWSNKNSNLNTGNRIIGFIKRPSFYLEPDFILGASDMMNGIFANMFNANINKCHSILYPRCVYLRQPIDKLNSYIQKWEDKDLNEFVEKIKTYESVFLYMPTYRDNDPHFLKNQKWNLNQLNASLSDNKSLLIVKLHPHMLNEVHFDGYSNIVEIDKKYDIYPILPFTNTLITDYSSIYYDYILMDDKSVILYIPDIDDYISKSRDLLMKYDDNCKGVVTNSFSSLLDAMNTEKEIDYLKIREKFWGNALNTGFEDLYLALKKI